MRRQTLGEATAAGIRGGYTELQTALLCAYRDNPGASRQELAAILGVGPSSLSGPLIKLQERGLIPKMRLPYPKTHK